LRDFGFSIQNNSYLFNLIELILLCATSHLRGFGSSIQNNFFSLMKIFFLCATWQLKDFGFSSQNNSYFFNSMNFCFLCATSQLKDFGSSIQNNSYFFNSMKIFFLCVLLHNWRILVRRFKTTHTSSTPWKFSSIVCYFTIEGFWFVDSKQLVLLQLHENFLHLCATSQLKDFGSSIQNNSYFFNSMKTFFNCVLLHYWRILVLRFKTTHTSSTPWKFSSIVCYFTIEGFWFYDSKQLVLLQIEFHNYLKTSKALISLCL